MATHLCVCVHLCLNIIRFTKFLYTVYGVMMVLHTICRFSSLGHPA